MTDHGPQPKNSFRAADGRMVAGWLCYEGGMPKVPRWFPLPKGPRLTWSVHIMLFPSSPFLGGAFQRAASDSILDPDGRRTVGEGLARPG